MQSYVCPINIRTNLRRMLEHLLSPCMHSQVGLPLGLGVHRRVHCWRVVCNDVDSALNALVWRSLRHAAPMQHSQLYNTVGRKQSQNSKDGSAPCSPFAPIRRPQQTLVFALPFFHGTRKARPCAARQRHGRLTDISVRGRVARFTRNRYSEVGRVCVRYRAHPECLTWMTGSSFAPAERSNDTHSVRSLAAAHTRAV